MTTLAVALAEIAALKARVDALEGGGARPSSNGGGGNGAPGDGEALPDHLLDNAWANKKIAKDPRQWKGPTQVNRTYSRAPSEWLLMAAHNKEFQAQKEREEVPVKLQTSGKNAGKPWHESTSFEAKILRGWARRNAAKAPPPASSGSTTRQAAPADDYDFGSNATGSDDEIPF